MTPPSLPPRPAHPPDSTVPALQGRSRTLALRPVTDVAKRRKDACAEEERHLDEAKRQADALRSTEAILAEVTARIKAEFAKLATAVNKQCWHEAATRAAKSTAFALVEERRRHKAVLAAEANERHRHETVLAAEVDECRRHKAVSAVEADNCRRHKAVLVAEAANKQRRQELAALLRSPTW